ncbi:uncharacterized protein LOC113352018 [Papaver somniferum]|uniref:uncharacterized protein LOC113352018 n=1 Tax=Papaver somniferum TaxID=3469 RepID=UPI000E6F94DC|nr:uncharacterized protein LOC113352018 [Papaver somniferum]
MSQYGKSLMIKTATNTIPTYSMSCLQILAKKIKKIDAVKRDLWWGFEEKRGTYFTSWKNLSLHKNLGGQGFRDLRVLNQSLLVRAAWRICINVYEQWVKAMQAKYFPSTSLLHASIKTNCSWAWNGIQKQVRFKKQHSRWRLGKGNKIKLWLNDWVVGMDTPPALRNGASDS